MNTVSPAPLSAIPDHTAVRVALWRALHTLIDAPPHVLEDDIGRQLAAPENGWRQRPDMHPDFSKGVRAWMATRSRFVEDLVAERAGQGVAQYVLLGAGLDTFAQRRPELAARLRIFEIDQPATQTWKRQRLRELGLNSPPQPHLVAADLASANWPDALLRPDSSAGFDPHQPAVVACTGVSLYLAPEAVLNLLRQTASLLAPRSILAMTFLLPADLIDAADQPLQQISEKGARAAGTPFLSHFAHGEIQALAREAGYRQMQVVSSQDLARRYFTGRTDGLKPASGEDFLVAET